MAKVIDATCIAGVVTADLLPVPTADIFSKGLGPSVGALIMDEDRQVYITNTQTDLDSTLASLVSVLNTIASALTAIGASMTGPTTAPPPTLAASVTAINTVVTQLTTLKGVLK